MQRSIKRLFVTKVLLEDQILRSQHRFTTHVIGIHAFPSAGKRTTMEDDHQSMIIGIAENVFIKTHRLLLVTTKEIHFNAFHSQLLHPAHLLFADNGIIHPVDRTLLDIIPIATGTVPEKYLHPFTTGIPDELCHAVVADVLIPPIINKHIFISHGSSEINIFHLVFIIYTVILPKYPTPGATPHIVIVLCFIKRFYHVPRNGSFYNRS